LKTKPAELLRTTWRGLTDVPGWPDAPLTQRIRRTLPIMLPLLATCVLLAWHFGYTAPRLRAAYTSHQPWLKLERDVANLHLAFSELQVNELATREATLRRQLPQDAQEIREVLKLIEREAQRLAWEISFSNPTLPDSPASTDALVADVPVRTRLRPAAGNTDPFSSLLTLLEQIPTFSRRIALMRLSISADEGKWQAVEVGLRFTVPIPHAQAAQ
jgi:hypothetical protein